MDPTDSTLYHDPAIARGLVARIRSISRRPLRLMEVCGTHTVAIFRAGIRSLLPPEIALLSGPGCPVCVTAQGEIDAFIALARQPGAIVCTFGDLLRVPGSGSSLQRERTAGADVRVVYSTLDALRVARENPARPVVFLGVGFETTAPTVAAAIRMAREEGLVNFLVFSAHKLAPPALAALLQSDAVCIDGFILPGHVSVIIGSEAFAPLFARHRIPCVVAGFEPLDILRAILMLVQQIETGRPAIENAYPRAVSSGGNRAARQLMEEVFEVSDATWRGLGVIPESGLRLRETFAAHDAARHFGLQTLEVPEPRGCACGAILTGVRIPPECPLFRRTCTPMSPVGPCMVSSEGTCAAYYRYHDPSLDTGQGA